MKLALVTWSYDTFQGISRCVVELASRLACRHDVHVFTTTIEESPPPGVTVHRVDLRVRRFYLAEWEFFVKAGAQLRRQHFDVVHLHFPVWFPAHVFTCHGVARSALRRMRSFPRGPRRDVSLGRMLPYYLQLPLYGYHLRNPQTLITAVSQKAKQEVVHDYGRRPEEILVIPNGVDLDRFHPRLVPQWRGPVRARLGIREDQVILLFVGNHFRHKGARYALETLQRLPEQVVLVVVGADSPENLPDPHGLLAGLVRSRRLIFAGVEREVWRYYAAADVLLFPSLYESFGLVALEAMAIGLPVITTRTVALGDEVIRDGENGFVVDSPWDVDGLAARVRALLNDPELSRQVGVRAREVAETYSWNSYVALTEELYKTILHGTGPRPALASTSRPTRPERTHD